MAAVRTDRIHTRSIVTSVRMPQTFVDIDARISRRRQLITLRANALKASLKIVAFSVLTNKVSL